MDENSLALRVSGLGPLSRRKIVKRSGVTNHATRILTHIVKTEVLFFPQHPASICPLACLSQEGPGIPSRSAIARRNKDSRWTGFQRKQVRIKSLPTSCWSEIET